jgi:hypothetical protein
VTLDASSGIHRASERTIAMATTSAPSAAPNVETLSKPLDGLTEAEIRIGFGGGELAIHRAEPGILLSGTFEDGVTERSAGAGRIELQPRTVAWPMVVCAPLHWDVGISAEIPVDLRLDTGANRSVVDLGALRIRRLELHTGASETIVHLPHTGITAVRVECGFASVTLHVPAGVAALIRGKMAIGATEVDETRFPREPDGWRSPDYETAVNRVYLEIDGGFGSVRVA